MVAFAEPLDRFRSTFDRALATHPFDAHAVALATADETGAPSVRMVLFRGLDAGGGFVFHTNYESRKGRQLAANPRAALCFYWASLDEQIRIEGAVAKLDPARSDAYFASRPRGSQIGAWASPQSRAIVSRAELAERLKEIEARFSAGPVPRPPFWGGFELRAERIEFWHQGESRLHDRILYERAGEGWATSILAP